MQELKDKTGIVENYEIAEDLSNLLRVISHFFAFGNIEYKRRFLKDWFEATFAKDTYWEGEPGGLVFQHHLICKLIHAAHLVYLEKFKLHEHASADFNRHTFPKDPLGKIAGIASKIHDWNDFPCLLNYNDLDDPYYIFKDFFDYLSIEEWEAELSCWLQASLSKQSIFSLSKPERFPSIMLHLQKLIEAVSLIHIMEGDGGKDDKEDDEENPENLGEDQTEEGNNPARFQKPERLIDKVAAGSEAYMKEAFLTLQLDDIKEEIDGWLSIALVNDNSAYEEGRAREDLMDFCSELQLLAEAFHVMNESAKPEEANAWKKNLQPDLKEKVDQLNQLELLTPEQTEDPMSVIHDFCKRFKLSYCRTELWDLLDAVITYEGEKEVVKINLLLVYECIASIIEVAYILHKRKAIPMILK